MRRWVVLLIGLTLGGVLQYGIDHPPVRESLYRPVVMDGWFSVGDLSNPIIVRGPVFAHPKECFAYVLSHWPKDAPGWCAEIFTK